jgi:hypothetical protein
MMTLSGARAWPLQVSRARQLSASGCVGAMLLSPNVSPLRRVFGDLSSIWVVFRLLDAYLFEFYGLPASRDVE